MSINTVTIFCGASSGKNELYVKQAYTLGQYLAQNNITIIYGGGFVGMMGAVANGALDKNGRVIGVIPQFLIDREMAHPNVKEMEVVTTMHQRKARMEEMGDAIIMLPGGAGTLEEFFEIFTWGQLGLHEKPIGILDVNNFFEPLITLMDHMIKEKFLEERYRKLLHIHSTKETLIESLQSFEPLKVRTYEDIKNLSNH